MSAPPKVTFFHIESVLARSGRGGYMKTTWFPGHISPVREGLYETQVDGGLTWSIWKNGFWHFASPHPEYAVEMAEKGHVSFWQKREWRGLTECAE